MQINNDIDDDNFVVYVMYVVVLRLQEISHRFFFMVFMLFANLAF